MPSVNKKVNVKRTTEAHNFIIFSFMDVDGAEKYFSII